MTVESYVATTTSAISKPPLRVALLGAGGISPEHADALRKIPETQMVAVCDLSSARAKSLASKYCIPAVCCTLQEMVGKTKPDVIHVLTPPQSHIRLATEVVELGCHAFVEKPLGLSVADCQALKERARARGRIVGVNHNVASKPIVDDMVSIVSSGRLGRVNHVSVSWVTQPSAVPLRDAAQFMFQHPFNMMFELGPHPMSIIQRLMGGPKEVSALCMDPTNVAGDKKFYATWLVNATTERGTAHLYLAVGRGYGEVSATVLGEDGLAYVDLLRHSIQIFENSEYRIYGNLIQSIRKARAVLNGALRPYRSRFKKIIGKGFDPQLDPMYWSVNKFYAEILHDRKSFEDIEAATSVIDYCERATKSAIVVN